MPLKIDKDTEKLEKMDIEEKMSPYESPIDFNNELFNFNDYDDFEVLLNNSDNNICELNQNRQKSHNIQNELDNNLEFGIKEIFNDTSDIRLLKELLDESNLMTNSLNINNKLEINAELEKIFDIKNDSYTSVEIEKNILDWIKNPEIKSLLDVYKYMQSFITDMKTRFEYKNKAQLKKNLDRNIHFDLREAEILFSFCDFQNWHKLNEYHVALMEEKSGLQEIYEAPENNNHGFAYLDMDCEDQNISSEDETRMDIQFENYMDKSKTNEIYLLPGVERQTSNEINTSKVICKNTNIFFKSK